MAKELLAPTLAGPFSPFLFSNDPADDHFRPQQIHASPVLLLDHIEQTPKTSNALHAEFETPKNGSRMGNVSLRFSVSPLARANGSGTYARLPNFAGFYLIKSVLVRYGNNKLGNTLDGEAMLGMWRKNMKQEDLDLLAMSTGGNMSDGQRNAAAAGWQTFTVPLYLPWVDDPRKWIPVENFQNGIDIIVDFHAPRDVCDTDATGVQATINDMKIKVVMTNQSKAVMDDIFAVCNSAEGMIIPFCDVETTESKPISALTTEVKTFELRQIRGYVTAFHVSVYPKAKRLPLHYDPEAKNNIKTLAIKANNSDLLKEVDNQYVHTELWRMFFPGPVIPGTFGYSFSLSPTETYHNYGCVYFGGLRDPMAWLTFAAGELAGDPVADLYEAKMTAYVANCLQIKGDTIVTLLV